MMIVFIVLFLVCVPGVSSITDGSSISKINTCKDTTIIEYRLQIMEYLSKRGYNSRYLSSHVDKLMEEGQIMMHSGSFRSIGLSSSKDIVTWSCCYDRFDRKDLEMWGKKTGGYNKKINARPMSDNPLIKHQHECGDPLTITLNDIISIDKNNEIQSQINQENDKSVLISTLNHANYIYAEKSGTLYQIDDKLSYQEIKILHDIFHHKMPNDYYSILCSKNAININISFPVINYSFFNFSNQYQYVFDAVDLNVTTIKESKSIVFKLGKYEQLLSKTKSILKKNKELKLKLEGKDNQINELKSQIELFKLNKNDPNEVEINEDEIFNFN